MCSEDRKVSDPASGSNGICQKGFMSGTITETEDTVLSAKKKDLLRTMIAVKAQEVGATDALAAPARAKATAF